MSDGAGTDDRARVTSDERRPDVRVSPLSRRFGPGGHAPFGDRVPRLDRRALAVLVAAAAFTVIYTLLSWLQYRAYMDARYDLGNMVQAVYNTAHGHFLEITSGDVRPRQMSRLGSHVDPILALFALPWLVWPSPVMLLAGQALIVATGAWPAYRLGTRIIGDAGAGVLFAAAYLLYPALGFLVLNEFHPVALATPLLLWAFVALEERRWAAAAVALILAAACKETVPLAIAFMGAFFALRQRSPRPLLVTAAAVVWFALAVWVVIPHYNGDQSAFVARYGAYGSGAGEVAVNAVLHPARTAGDLLSAANVEYWFKLLWPLGFTSLLSPLTLLIAAPEALLNALSTTVFQRRIEFHYTALEIPFVFAAAVLGTARLWRLVRRFAAGNGRGLDGGGDGRRKVGCAAAAAVLLCAAAANYTLGPLPFSLPGAAYSAERYARSAHDDVLDQAVALIPADAVVSVNNNAGAQLASRRVSYVFPYYAAADWVLVDERHPFFRDREEAPRHRQALNQLEQDPDFRSIFERDGVQVFRRVEGDHNEAENRRGGSFGFRPPS